MSAPFYKFGLFGDEFSLIVAFVIGIAFGFVLERAGFGSARKLAAQFYLTDMSVLKVMFTAIVTAMIGVYVLARLGWMDLSLVYLTPTFLAPQILGGLLLGAGFVIGGYCPGTSVVSSATGRLDGMVYVAGLVAGIVFYGEIYPAISDFTRTTAMGQVTLPQLFHIPYGVLVLAVVIMALGMFAGAEWVEAKLSGNRPPVPPALLGPPARFTPVRKLMVVLVALGALAAVGGNPYRGARVTVDAKALALSAASDAQQVRVRDLADWLVKGEMDCLLVDVRAPEAFAKYHIPGAQNVPLAALDSDLAAHNEKILVYSDRDLLSAQAWFLLKAMGFPSVHVLKGGLQAWREEVLFPAKPEPATPEQLAEFNKRAEVAKFFGGKPRGATSGGGPAALPEIKAPGSPAGAAVPRRSRKKHREGC